MADEGVIDATLEEARKHPWMIAAGLVGLFAVIWLAAGHSTAKAQQFSFSYGPSDAQVKAGTALAIQQAADQTAVSVAGIQAGTAQDYFGYLATANANNVSGAVTMNAANNATTQYVTASNNAAGVTINGANNQTQRQAIDAGLAANANNNWTQQQRIAADVTINANNDWTQQQAITAGVTTAGYAMQTSQYHDLMAATSADTIAGINANASILNKQQDSAVAIYKTATGAQVANHSLDVSANLGLASINADQQIQNASIYANALNAQLVRGGGGGGGGSGNGWLSTVGSVLSIAAAFI